MVLKLNSFGSEVRKLQIRLNELKFTCGTVDGDFGKKTEIAVKNFQRANKLVIDGVVGQKTWDKLFPKLSVVKQVVNKVKEVINKPKTNFRMKYEIVTQYLPNNSKRRSGKPIEKVGFFVAHDTGNEDSTARGNVKYYTNSAYQESASAHVFVDDKIIVECIPLFTSKPEKAWHVLYGKPLDNKIYGDDANDIAGGIELCYGKDINPDEAYKRYVWLLAYGCFKFKLDPSKAIIGHMILDPQRKTDPKNALSKMSKSYEQLLKDVVAEYNACLY